mgnify:CR=1 FL=1
MSTGNPREKRFKYVGAYGRRHAAAFCDGIGSLYYGEIVRLDEEAGMFRFDRQGMDPVPVSPRALEMLRGGEFECAESFCAHQFMNGDYCMSPPIAGDEYCSFHKAQLVKPPRSIKSPAIDQNAKSKDNFAEPRNGVT